MENVPARTHAFVSSASRIMVPKAINQSVPNGRISGNEERLAERYPDVLDNQETTVKIENIEVFREANAFRVLGEAIVKRFACGIPFRASAFSRARMNCFSDINRRGEPVIPVSTS